MKGDHHKNVHCPHGAPRVESRYQAHFLAAKTNENMITYYTERWRAKFIPVHVAEERSQFIF